MRCRPPAFQRPPGKQQFDVSAALDITSLTLSQTPPSLLELLPEELAKTIPQSIARPLSGEFVAVDMNFVEVQYHDTNGKEAGRFGPDRGGSIDGVVQRFERKRTKLLTARATLAALRPGPRRRPARDELRGCRAGAPQAHEGGPGPRRKRAFDEAEKSGLIKPMDSGKLFISEGEDELIAIIDEPPAAWPRISIGAGSADPAEIFAGIEKKYGKPGGNQAMRAGTIVSWYPLNGSACRSLYQSGQAYPLKEAWFEDGRPLTKVPINSVQQKAAPLPEPLFDPLSERSQHWTQCGPYITAQLGTEAMIGKPRDELDMTWTDIGPYLSAYAESRAKVQATGDSAQRPAAGIKF
jgi:hypothetical protein